MMTELRAWMRIAKAIDELRTVKPGGVRNE